MRLTHWLLLTLFLLFSSQLVASCSIEYAEAGYITTNVTAGGLATNKGTIEDVDFRGKFLTQNYNGNFNQLSDYLRSVGFVVNTPLHPKRQQIFFHNDNAKAYYDGLAVIRSTMIEDTNCDVSLYSHGEGIYYDIWESLKLNRISERLDPFDYNLSKVSDFAKNGENRGSTHLRIINFIGWDLPPEMVSSALSQPAGQTPWKKVSDFNREFFVRKNLGPGAEDSTNLFVRDYDGSTEAMHAYSVFYPQEDHFVIVLLLFTKNPILSDNSIHESHDDIRRLAESSVLATLPRAYYHSTEEYLLDCQRQINGLDGNEYDLDELSYYYDTNSIEYYDEAVKITSGLISDSLSVKKNCEDDERYVKSEFEDFNALVQLVENNQSPFGDIFEDYNAFVQPEFSWVLETKNHFSEDFARLDEKLQEYRSWKANYEWKRADLHFKKRIDDDIKQAAEDRQNFILGLLATIILSTISLILSAIGIVISIHYGRKKN